MAVVITHTHTHTRDGKFCKKEKAAGGFDRGTAKPRGGSALSRGKEGFSRNQGGGGGVAGVSRN